MFSETGSVGTATTRGVEREVVLSPEDLLPLRLGAAASWGSEVGTQHTFSPGSWVPNLLHPGKAPGAPPGRGGCGGSWAEERAFTLCLLSLTTGIETLRSLCSQLLPTLSKRGGGPDEDSGGGEDGVLRESEGAPAGPGDCSKQGNLVERRLLLLFLAYGWKQGVWSPPSGNKSGRHSHGWKSSR